ncbi:hypothetical protein RV02_GL000524 [Enterococcus gilvus]|nr:hypothetical protein RV02_GL000524 [Enterococcus gilvus]
MFHSLKPINEKVNGNPLKRTKKLFEIFNLKRFDCLKRQKKNTKIHPLRNFSLFISKEQKTLR